MSFINKILNYLFLVIIFLFNVDFSFGQGITSTNVNMIEKHSGLPSNAFYSQLGSPKGYDPGDTNAVTIEAEELVLTSSIINSLNQGGGYIQYEGSLTVGDAVNVYLVYLNHVNTNYRNPKNGVLGGTVTFDYEILGIYLDADQFKHFTGSSFASSYYDSSPNGDMHFEPGNWNNGSPHSSWSDTNDKDWFTVTNSNKTFTMGCKNGEKGDFFRIVTKACSVPTADAGSNATITCTNPNATLGVSAVSGYTYAWTPSTGLSSTTVARPTATPSSTITYSLVVTNAAGCESIADTVVVTVDKSTPSASAGLNATIDCNNTSATLGVSAESGYTYAWSPTTGLSNANIAQPTATPDNTTTYTLVVTKSSTGCTNSDTVLVTVDNTPPTPNAGSDVTIDCNTTSATIGSSAVSGHTYAWTPTNGLSSSTAAQPSASPDTTTAYTVVVTNASTGCSSVGDTVIVTVNKTTPSADAGSDATIDCNNTSATIGSSAVSGLTYAWSPSTGLSATNVAQPSANPNTTTTYTLVVTNPTNGCSSSDTVEVTVSTATPTANAGSDATIDCNNTSATLGASAVSGLTYAWSPSTGLSSTTVAQPTATPNTTTTYSLVVTNASTGCQSVADTVEVTVSTATPTANAGSDATIDCNNTSATLGASAVSGLTYAWSPSTGLSATNVAQPTATPNTTTTYSLVVTNASTGCQSVADTVEVTVSTATPTADAGSDAAIGCSVTSVTLGASAVSGLTYAWSPSTGLSATNVAQPTATPNTTTTYSLVVTNASTGCQSVADTVEVTVDTATPTADAGSDGAIDCTNSSVNLGTSAVSGFSYQWTPSTGLSAANVAQPTATPATTTTYSLVVTKDSSGCSSVADTVVVTVGTDLPSPDAGSDATIDCNNTSATIGTSAVSGFSYQWSPSTGLSSTTVAQPTATPNTTTTYSLVVTEIATGCSGADTVVVTVSTATPTADAGSDAEIGCSVTSVVLGSSAVSGFTYAWSPSTGLSATNVAQPTASPDSTTTYSLTVTNASTGCSSVADTVVVTVDTATPTANAGSDGTIDCSNTSVTLGASAVSGYTYAWSPSTGLSATNIAQPIATPNTTTTYSLVITKDSSGCSSIADTVVVTVEDLPIANAGSDTTIDCSNSSATLGTSAVSGYTYQWSPSTGLSSTTAAQPTATPDSTTTYSLIITESSSGCSSVADTVVVTVEDTPSADAGSDATINCTITSVTLGASAVSGYTYQWSPTTGLNDATLAQPTASPDSTTTYSLVSTNASTGCQSTADTVVVTVNISTPTAVAETPIIVDCTSGSSLATIDGAGSSTGSGYTYSWSTSDGVISGATNALTATAVYAGTYTLSVIDTATGCVSTTDVLVVIPDQEIAEVSYGTSTETASYCSTDSDPTPSIGENGTAGGTFSSAPAGLVINTSTGEIDLSASTPGDYIVSYITSASNCGAVDHYPLSISGDCDGDGVLDTTEILNGTDPSDPCDYNSADVTLPQSGDYLAADCDGDGVTNGDELNPPDGESPTDPQDPCSKNSSDITLTQTESYLSADCDGDGATNADELNPPDGEPATDPNDPCDTNLSDITLVKSGPYLLADCDGDGVTNGDELNPPDGEPATDPNDSCSSNLSDITLTQSGDYLLADCDGDGVTNGDELSPPDGESATDPNDPCNSLASDITLTKSGAYLLADCDGDGVTNGDELNPPGGEAATDPNDPCSSITSDISLAQSGDYLSEDCDGDGVINGDELTPPDGEAATDPNDPCSINSSDITVAVTSTVGCFAEINVTKTANDNGTSLGNTIYYTIVVENTGTQALNNITLTDTFTDSKGNTLTLTNEPYFINSDLGSPEGSLLAGEKATYMADYIIAQEALNGGGVSNSVLATASTANSDIVTDVSDDGDDSDGNTTDDPTETAIGDGECKIYSEFSPNGDGVNDTFIISCIDNYPNNVLEIYNRWGNVVYKQSGYKNDWSGSSNGRFIYNENEDLPVGTYYYKLDLGDGSEPKLGWIYLNR